MIATIGKWLLLLFLFICLPAVSFASETTAAGPKIAAGDYHTVLLDSDSSVWTWGNNMSGQLGNNSSSSSATPVQVVSTYGTGHQYGIIAVAAGNAHSVALGAGGNVLTWGENSFGQLGTGNNDGSGIPVVVADSDGTGILNKVTAIAAGREHTLALKSDGTVLAWGKNDQGQLGLDPTATAASNLPVQVAGLTSIIGIASAGAHSLALKSDGTVWTWGGNGSGQLGDNTLTARYNPAQVKGSSGSGVLSGVIKLAAGRGHSLALLDDGTVWAWGNNGTGQTALIPVKVSGLGYVTSISAGEMRSFAIAGTTRYGWGANEYGQVGDGTTSDRLTPSAISGLDGAATIVAGRYHSAAVTADGKVWTWGHNNFGQLGDGTATDRLAPAMVTGLTVGKITAIAAGEAHSMAVESNGYVWSWGDNVSGQLGSGDYLDGLSPARTAAGVGIANVISPAAGRISSLALSSKGTVYSWGDNSQGQLGIGSTTDSNTPGYVWLGLLPFFGVKSVAASGDFALALKADGTVWAWGDKTFDQLGRGDGSTTDILSPVQSWSGQLDGVTAIAAGRYHALAQISNGTIRSWGYNALGQLGDGTTSNSTTAPKVVKEGTDIISGTLGNVAAVAAGNNHSLALLSSGVVMSWGYNGYGQLGNNDASHQSQKRAALVVSNTGTGFLGRVRAIAAGANHSLALLDDSTVWAWGNNTYGQLGNGTTTNSDVPVQVVTGPGGFFSLLYDVVAIAAGGDHSMALTVNGTVLTWGYNNNGQLGDGTKNNNSYAVTAPQITSPSSPTVSFTSTPPQKTASDYLPFTFVSSQLNSTFTCFFDGDEGWPCSSPMQYHAGAGDHTFGVAATNSASVTGPVNTYAWTVDACGFKVGITCYATIDDAYSAVADNGTIKVRSNAITSPANFSRADNIAFTLQGGYESTYTTPSLAPSVFPAMTISKGRVNAKNLVIR